MNQDTIVDDTPAQEPTEKHHEPDKPTSPLVTLAELAKRWDLTSNGVRSRLKRANITFELDSGGRTVIAEAEIEGLGYARRATGRQMSQAKTFEPRPAPAPEIPQVVDQVRAIMVPPVVGEISLVAADQEKIRRLLLALQKIADATAAEEADSFASYAVHFLALYVLKAEGGESGG